VIPGEGEGHARGEVNSSHYGERTLTMQGWY
jgi:hypothetical protein